MQCALEGRKEGRKEGPIECLECSACCSKYWKCPLHSRMQAQILFSMFAETLHSVWKVIFEIWLSIVF